MNVIRKNLFKQGIKKFEKQIGIWSCTSSNVVIDILGTVGFDWIVIDMEHSPNDIQEVLTQLQIIQGGFKSEPVVRVPWNVSEPSEYLQFDNRNHVSLDAGTSRRQAYP